MDGILFECSKYYKRKGLHQPLLENNAVLLANGKMAVDSLQAVPFILGNIADAETYGFDNPCPGTAARVAAYDDNATAMSTPVFKKITAMPTESNVIVSKYSVQTEDQKLFASLINVITDPDEASLLEDTASGSGVQLIQCMRAEAAKATPKDKVLVTETRNHHVSVGIPSEVTLATFNAFLKEFNRLERYTPKDDRMKDDRVSQMIHTIMYKDPGVRDLFEMNLKVSPPTNSASLVTSVRDMLRSRLVSKQLAEVATGAPTIPLAANTALIAAAQSVAALEATRAAHGTLTAAQISCLDSAKALLTGPSPRKTPRKHATGGAIAATTPKSGSLQRPRPTN